MSMFSPLSPNSDSFKPVYDDKALVITPLYYPWSMVNDLFFKSLIPDEYFKQLVVDFTMPRENFSSVADRNHNDLAGLINVYATSTGIAKASRAHSDNDYNIVFGSYSSPSFSLHHVLTDMQADINLAASMFKAIAWDSLYAVCSGTMPENPISFKEVTGADGTILNVADAGKEAAQKTYDKLFKRIRVMHLANLRKTMLHMLKDSKDNGTIIDESTGEYSIASGSPCYDIACVIIRHLIRELSKTYCMSSKSTLMGRGTVVGYGDFEETVVAVTETVLDVELKGMEYNNEDISDSLYSDEEEDDGTIKKMQKIVRHKAEEIISIAGGGVDFENHHKFADKLIDLCVGSRFTSSGLFLEKMKGGAKTEENDSSSKLHRMGKLDRSIFSHGLSGQRYVENKARNKALVVKKTEHEEESTGGDVYFLADTTGSTTWAGGDQIALMYIIESLACAIAEAARNGERNSNFFFYDMGLNSVSRIEYDCTDEEFDVKKWSLLGRSRSSGNDEIAAFVQLRREIMFLRDDGTGTEETKKSLVERAKELDAAELPEESEAEKVTVIFVTDGGMLTNSSSLLDAEVGATNKRNRISEGRKLNLMLKDLRQNNVEIMPILFSSDIDRVCAEVFDGFPVAHIKATDDFGIDEINELLVAVNPKLMEGEEEDTATY